MTSKADPVAVVPGRHNSADVANAVSSTRGNIPLDDATHSYLRNVAHLDKQGLSATEIRDQLHPSLYKGAPNAHKYQDEAKDEKNLRRVLKALALLQEGE